MTPLDPAHIEPLDGSRAGDLGAAVGTDISLGEALAVLLRDDQGVVGVRDGAQFVGVLTPNGVHRALRAALAEMSAET